MYKKALEEGKASVKRLPIMLIGQGRAGKTSLKKSLMGDRFDAEEESTTGIEMDPSHWRVTTEIWKTGECGLLACKDSAISFDHHAARLIARDLTDKNQVSKATTGESSQTSETDQSFLTRQVDSSEGPNQTSSNATILIQGQEKVQMPDDLANLTTKLICESTEVDDEGEIYSTLWDFGGQSVYYVTHPLFLTSRAIYLLVCDLSQNPSDETTPLLKQGMFTKLEDSFGSKTNLDYLHSWLSSVASLASNDDEVQTGHLSEKLPKKLPPVILVCTHADQPYDGRDSATVAAEIFGFLQGKSYSGHLLDSVFAVDNTKSGTLPECPEVLRLRKEILAVAKELPQINEQIPLKWLRFEKELQDRIEEGCKWISFSEAREIAVEVCHISDEGEFVTLMKLLHDQRIIIHFDDTPNLNKMVILDIQWLIDVFKKVITIKPYDGKQRQHKDLWIKLEKTGILDEKLLEHAWGPLYNHKETLESLIEIMEKFSLLCVWPSSDVSKEYLVPSMLMSHPPEDIIRLVKSSRSQIPSLYLTFNSSQVPIGLFPRMVLHFYQWCSKEWPSPRKPQFYQKFVRFHIDPEAGCSVILLCHSSFIEIVVHRAISEVRNLSERLMTMAKVSPNLLNHLPDVTVARAVRRQVELMLECMRKEFVWLRNMECKMKVLCSVCCSDGTVHYCHDHGIKECKQEECLHFWSEAELRSGQQFCDRSVVAGNLKLNPQLLRSWFAVVDDQVSIFQKDSCKVQ